ncbi:MAG: serine/threonine protein kinase [Myxococcales bacterium]|nr:serine/threonine protein kinase [Myxococcales bacterium]
MPTCPICQTAFPPATVICPSDGCALAVDPALLVTAPGDPPSATKAPDPLIGTTLVGRFNITRRIGEGGMGVVYEATHAVIGRSVAIKILHEKYAEKPEIAARLTNEARLASSIHHDHIVDIFDVGETADGRAFVVMELLDGESLAQLIRREAPLPEERAIDLALQTASALGAAHEQGIIHRDVKPENIFLVRRSGAEFAKVVDFGISKAIRPGPDGEVTPRLTHTGQVLGTPLYMSPEQARGEEDVDHRIDVYAVGVILYECLTGEVPFSATNYLGIISKVLKDTPISPRKLRPEQRISEGMERVVLRAMARSRDDRYESMAELEVDLRRVVAGEPIAALASEILPAPAVERPRRLMRTLATVAALVVAGGIATTVVVLRTGEVPVPVAAAPRSDMVALPPPPTPPPPPSPTVVVKVTSTPSGAEIFDGSRRLGVAPGLITLTRSDQAVHLTFRLAGHEDAVHDLLPKIDGEELNIALAALKKTPRPRPQRPSVESPKIAPIDPPPAPNPYTKKQVPSP